MGFVTEFHQVWVAWGGLTIVPGHIPLPDIPDLGPHPVMSKDNFWPYAPGIICSASVWAGSIQVTIHWSVSIIYRSWYFSTVKLCHLASKTKKMHLKQTLKLFSYNLNVYEAQGQMVQEAIVKPICKGTKL